MYWCKNLETTWIPRKPPTKHARRTHDASCVESPPLIKALFEDGSILYKAEKICTDQLESSTSEESLLTITPKLKLSDEDRNALLSCIRKFFLLGISRMRTSMQIMLAPAIHAKIKLVAYSNWLLTSHLRGGLLCCMVGFLTNATDDTHDPAAGIIVDLPTGVHNRI